MLVLLFFFRGKVGFPGLHGQSVVKTWEVNLFQKEKELLKNRAHGSLYIFQYGMATSGSSRRGLDWFAFKQLAC